jgi:6-phosphogluconolactonase
VELKKFNSLSQMEQAALKALREEMQAEADTPHAIMLTGGSTPLGLYRHIEQRPFAVDGGLHVLLTDERYVTIESPESNFGHVAGMLRALGVADTNIMRVRTELPLQDAAERYHARLAGYLEKGGTIPLGILGLGADGHVASLFSADDVVRGQGRFAIAVKRANGPDRVSVTRDLLLRVDRLVFLIHGREKAEAVDRLLQKPESIPAGLALEGKEGVDVWYCPR